MELHDSSKQLTPFVKVIYLRCLSWLIQRRELMPGQTVIRKGEGQAGEPGPIHRGRKGGAYKRTPQPAISAASRATSTPLVITTRTKVQPTIWQTTSCCRRILLATAVRRSLTIGNSFTLSMVILPLWVSVFQGPPGLETIQAGWNPIHLPGIQAMPTFSVVSELTPLQPLINPPSCPSSSAGAASAVGVERI